MGLNGQLSGPITGAALVRPHRSGLTGAIRAAARAVAAADRDVRWRRRTLHHLEEVQRRFAEHIVLTEGLDGLYAEVLDASPRLARHVRLLIRDHVLLAEAVVVLVEQLDRPAAVLRCHTADLDRLWTRHRQRGADLLHAAYGTDIGGET